MPRSSLIGATHSQECVSGVEASPWYRVGGSKIVAHRPDFCPGSSKRDQATADNVAFRPLILRVQSKRRTSEHPRVRFGRCGPGEGNSQTLIVTKGLRCDRAARFRVGRVASKSLSYRRDRSCVKPARLNCRGYALATIPETIGRAGPQSPASVGRECSLGQRVGELSSAHISLLYHAVSAAEGGGQPIQQAYDRVKVRVPPRNLPYWLGPPWSGYRPASRF
jgi:hypothetical protein